jgi:hypothetical protein
MKLITLLTALIVAANQEILYEFDWINNLGPYL